MKGNKNIFIYNIDNKDYNDNDIYKINEHELEKQFHPVQENNEKLYSDLLAYDLKTCDEKSSIDEAWHWWKIDRHQYPYC